MPSTSAQRMKRMRQLNKEDPERKHRKLDSLFMFGCVEIAVIVDLMGDIWFKAVDLARALEMEDPNTAIYEHLDPKNTIAYELLTSVSRRYRDIPGLHPATTFVNEAGMNKFVSRSRMPKAEAFADWVCGEVLPSIRKTGQYRVAAEQNPYRELNDVYKRQIEEMKEQMEEHKRELATCRLNETKLHAAIIKQTDALFSIKPRCVPETRDPLKREILLLIDKNLDAHAELDDGFPLYASRIQQAQFRETLARLKMDYPEYEVLRTFDTPNAVNLFNYIFENLPGVERKRDEKHRRALNSFRLRQDYPLDKFLAALDNLYRTTYFVEPTTTGAKLTTTEKPT